MAESDATGPQVARDEQLEVLRQWVTEDWFWPGALSGALFLSGVAAMLLYLILRFGAKERANALPTPAWSGLDVLLGFAFWLCLQYFAGVMAFLLPVVFGQDTVPDRTAELTRYALLLVVNLLSTVVLVMLPRLKYRQGPEVFGLEARRAPIGSILAVACYLASFFALLTLITLWVATLVSLGSEVEPQAALGFFFESVAARDALAITLVATVAVVGAPVLEEVLFRGLLFRWVAHRLGTGLGIVISGLAFGAIHIEAIAVVPTAILGMLLAYLYHRTNNLWLCIGFHALFNGGQLAMSAVAVR